MFNSECGKRLKQGRNNKRHTLKPESVVDNDIPKILRDFMIQTNQLSKAREGDLVLINKNLKSVC